MIVVTRPRKTVFREEEGSGEMTQGEVDVDDHVSASLGPCRAGDLHTFVKRAPEFSPSNSIPCKAK